MIMVGGIGRQLRRELPRPQRIHGRWMRGRVSTDGCRRGGRIQAPGCSRSDASARALLTSKWLAPGSYSEHVSIAYRWRGPFTSQEVNQLHAEAFGTETFSDADWDWVDLTGRYSLGWVTARDANGLAGFANVVWDGLVHAWLQDVMVACRVRRRGVGTALVGRARDGARVAGCEYLHVDFEDGLRPFYLGACGFSPTNAGLLKLD
jgi:GNAT superfamily N-acetyltransferase